MTKHIGSTFGNEIAAAGLGGLPFSWGADGDISFSDIITEAQRNAVMAVYDAHAAPSDLDNLKAARNAKINASRAAANTSTFGHGGKVFSCDQLSRSDIDGVNGYVALFGALPPTFPGAWKAVDNSYYPLADVAAWKAFYASMVATGAANYAHAQELKAQLAAAATAEAVAAIVW